MLASGLPGHIVNVSSIGGIAALGSVGLYATSKFAVVGSREALRTDMVGRPIGVSVYCPGPVKSNIGDSARSRPAELAESGYAAPGKEQGGPAAGIHAARHGCRHGGRLRAGWHSAQPAVHPQSPEFRDVLTARSNLLLGSIPE